MKSLVLVEKQQNYIRSAIILASISIVVVVAIGFCRILITDSLLFNLLLIVSIFVIISIKKKFLATRYHFTYGNDGKFIYKDTLSRKEGEPIHYAVKSCEKAEEDLQVNLYHEAGIYSQRTAVIKKALVGDENLNALEYFINNIKTITQSDMQEALQCEHSKTRIFGKQEGDNFTTLVRYKPDKISVSLLANGVFILGLLFLNWIIKVIML